VILCQDMMTPRSRSETKRIGCRTVAKARHRSMLASSHAQRLTRQWAVYQSPRMQHFDATFPDVHDDREHKLGPAGC